MFMTELFDAHASRNEVFKAQAGDMAAGLAWVEGEILPITQARIPILDQGFLHSDLTYDVPAAWDGRIFRFEDHLDRLEESCAKMQLRLPRPRAEVRDIILTMLAKSGLRDAYINIIVTRGLKFLREQPADQAINNLYIYVTPYVWVMPPQMQQSGGRAIITRTVRRVPPGAIDPTIKNLQWGDFVRGLIEARDRNSVYPILPDGDGNITEGSGFNVLLVKDGTIYTPDRGVLHGVTRRSVLELAQKLGIPTKLDVIPVEMAYQADEIFFSTTAGGVMPVVELDGKPVGCGEIGPITQAIWTAYWQAHYDPALTTEISYSKA